MSKDYLGYGIIGCGTFCAAYLSTLGPKYTNVRPVCCSDLNTAAAEAAAAKWNIPKVCTTEEMLADPDVDIVLILTTPASHYSLSMAALKAGKHVYCEKPLAPSIEEAKEIVAFAKKQGLYVGSAPDTFLSSEFQTVRKLIDEGQVGKVINVTANYVGPGADMWHPNADFLYKKGGGPVLDMAPYFLTTLVSLLGPIEQIFAFGTKGFEVRQIRDHECPVDVLTTFCGVLKFRSGAIANVNMSYDEWKSDLPGLEIYGTEGVIIAPDPNTMMGPIKLLKAADFKEMVLSKEQIPERLEAIYGPASFGLFKDVAPVSERLGNQRGLGVSDMADAIMNGRAPRVSADMCMHITEAINAFNNCPVTGVPYTMQTTFEIPAPLYG